MSILKMKQYGSVLTGREFGKKMMQELEGSLNFPVTLDFSEVLSLGSSFGDEIVPVIARRQNNTVFVINANKAIWDCLRQIMEDHHISVVEGPTV